MLSSLLQCIALPGDVGLAAPGSGSSMVSVERETRTWSG